MSGRTFALLYGYGGTAVVVIIGIVLCIRGRGDTQ